MTPHMLSILTGLECIACFNKLVVIWSFAYKMQSSFYPFRARYTFAQTGFYPCMICGFNTLPSVPRFRRWFFCKDTLIKRRLPSNQPRPLLTTSKGNQIGNRRYTQALRYILPPVTPSLHRLPESALCIHLRAASPHCLPSRNGHLKPIPLQSRP